VFHDRRRELHGNHLAAAFRWNASADLARITCKVTFDEVTVPADLQTLGKVIP